MTIVFSSLLGLYPLAAFLSNNSPGALERRYANENAPVVAAVRDVYVRNDWPGMDARPDEAEPVSLWSVDDADYQPIEAIVLRETP